MIFDMEPDRATIGNMDNTNEVFVPNIKEFSYIHIPGNLPSKVCSLEDFHYSTVYTKQSYCETIHQFWQIYEALNYPTLVAHNGNGFDFLILIASTYRYVANAANLVKKMTFFDTYVMIKIAKIKNRANLNMFLRYGQYYPQYHNLHFQQHQSLADCQMLLLWLVYYITPSISDISPPPMAPPSNVNSFIALR